MLPILSFPLGPANYEPDTGPNSDLFLKAVFDKIQRYKNSVKRDSLDHSATKTSRDRGAMILLTKELLES